MRQSKQFNVPMFALTILLGAAAWIICSAVYGALADAAPRPFLIGLVFGIFALVLAVGVFLISSLSGTFERNIITGGSAGSVIGFLAIAVVLIAALGALFQWLYSLRFSGPAAKPTSYIFLMDNSGSTAQSDPQQLRYDAIEDVLGEQDADFPYMVYGFADGVELIRDMKPASDGDNKLEAVSNGQTAILGVLTTAIDDYEAGRWDGGSAPKVILLSDGYPTDFTTYGELTPILRRYADSGVTISTVGLGSDTDVALMQHIAESTGGVFVDVSDASMLAQGLSTAAARSSADDLVSTRHSGGPLFGFLRVLFLTVLGMAIGLTAAAAYGQTDSVSLILLSSVVKSLVGALLLELATSLLGLPSQVFWFILWVLIAALLCTKAAAPRRAPTAPRRPARPKRRGGISNRDITHF